MLGGLTELHEPDIRDSEIFLNKMITKYGLKTNNIVELGAGIGRVSQHLFQKYFDHVGFIIFYSRF